MIPLGDVNDSRKIDSDQTWNGFRALIAKDMEIEVEKLNIGYKFSTARVKDLPKLLKTSDHFWDLWIDARKEVDNLKSKKSKTELKVQLVNLDSDSKKKKPAGNKKSVCVLLMTV